MPRLSRRAILALSFIIGLALWLIPAGFLHQSEPWDGNGPAYPLALLATGLLMVIGEPVRELVTFSFWLKMTLVAIGALVATSFQRAVRRHEQQWESTLVHRRSIQTLAILTFLIWVAIIVLGRLIAYDHVWGSWSPSEGQ